MPDDYVTVLADLKQRIAVAQARAALSVSRELVALYWHVGGTIVRRQATADWGDAVVERLAHDLRKAFPKLAGFSVRNIWRMRAFFLAWSGASRRGPRSLAKKLPQAVAEIPWGHNILLLEQLEEQEQRLWYAERTREQGWSRSVLQARIATRAHARQGKATTNFARSLSQPLAELAQQTLKDPYTFDFLTVGREAHERVSKGADAYPSPDGRCVGRRAASHDPSRPDTDWWRAHDVRATRLGRRKLVVYDTPPDQMWNATVRVERRN